MKILKWFTRRLTRVMGTWDFLRKSEIDELHLCGRRFTWSNRRGQPTLERLHRVLALPSGLAIFPSHLLKPLSSDCFDHCLLLPPSNKCRSLGQKSISVSILLDQASGLLQGGLFLGPQPYSMPTLSGNLTTSCATLLCSQELEHGACG